MTKKSEADWRTQLSPEEFHITREKGTERAFSGEYWDTKTKGQYMCKCCGEALFASDHKYDSGSGWPSFDRAMNAEAVREESDSSLGMKRTEVVCAKCDAHLGHMFPDGPQETTGVRYCINSASLSLEADDEG